VESARSAGTTREVLDAAESFDPDTARQAVNEADIERKETVQRYPLEAWPTMTLRDYAIGQADVSEPLGRWIEFQTPHMGSMRGGSARKHIIYKHRDKPGWHYPTQYDNQEQAWEAVRAGFVEAFRLAGEERWAEIDEIEALGPGAALLLKLLYAYFPDAMLPICSRDHLRRFLEIAGEKQASADQSLGPVQLNRSLLASLRKVPALGGLSTKELERFLYRKFSPFEPELYKIAPGHDAGYWEECLAGGYICLGWEEVGDLRQFESRDAFMEEYHRVFDEKSGRAKATEKAKELWSLMEIEEGHLIAANKGTSKILAVGKVGEAGYFWDGSRSAYRHMLPVEWDTSYATEIPQQRRWAFVTIGKIQGELRTTILSRGERDGQTISAEPLFEQIVESLDRRGQAILYGPPGTGKTWNAKRFAPWWLERENRAASDETESAPDPAAGTQTWCVVANPSEWTWDTLFEKGEQIFRRGRIDRNYEQIAPGDLVIGYTATPAKRVAALAPVARLDQANGETTFVLAPLARVSEGPTWDELQEDEYLAVSEPVRNRMQGTLLAFDEDQAERLVGLIAERDPEARGVLEDGRRPAHPQVRATTEALSWITFHPSYSYEDFVEGFRPSISGRGASLRLEDGVFKALCRRAERNPERKYLLVIDEINRANIAKVFGELITLIEKDKRGELWVTLPYSKERFVIPPNVFLLGTMNTADRSIRLLDTALRRRFGFVELMPRTDLLQGASVEGLSLETFLVRLNARIVELVGREKQIGHSFFLEEEQPITDAAQFARIFKQEIVPLLQEYALDDYDALADLLGEQIVNRQNKQLNTEVLNSPERLLEALEEIYGQREEAPE
jgi:5-methylcytosine-specific restriction protein B